MVISFCAKPLLRTTVATAFDPSTDTERRLMLPSGMVPGKPPIFPFSSDDAYWFQACAAWPLLASRIMDCTALRISLSDGAAGCSFWGGVSGSAAPVSTAAVSTGGGAA